MRTVGHYIWIGLPLDTAILLHQAQPDPAGIARTCIGWSSKQDCCLSIDFLGISDGCQLAVIIVTDAHGFRSRPCRSVIL